ncbi:hypothetical protein BDQ17DRAFT_1350626, partial [Cyathus striatus]
MAPLCLNFDWTSMHRLERPYIHPSWAQVMKSCQAAVKIFFVTPITYQMMTH